MLLLATYPAQAQADPASGVQRGVCWEPLAKGLQSFSCITITEVKTSSKKWVWKCMGRFLKKLGTPQNGRFIGFYWYDVSDFKDRGNYSFRPWPWAPPAVTVMDQALLTIQDCSHRLPVSSQILAAAEPTDT